MRILLVFLTVLMLPACASMGDRAAATLNAAGLEGTRWGLVVTTMDGRELVAIRPDERFTPASNTKLVTAAVAFHRLGDMTLPDPTMGTSVRIEPREGAPPDVALVGGGDAMLIDDDDCERDCLSNLADMVVSNGITEIGYVVADETRHPHEPIPPGWSHEDIVTRSGAPVSALTVNSNEVGLTIKPGAAAGDPAIVEWRDRPVLFMLDNDVMTVAAETSADDDVVVERQPGSLVVRVHGRVKANGAQVNRPVAVEDAAMAAAMRFRVLLEARGIKVRGIEARHRPIVLEGADGVAVAGPPRTSMEIGRILPPPLIEDVRFTLKQSQNLHAELLLRRVGLIEGDGSRLAGLKAVEAMLAEAGAPRAAWDFADGSGMSIYNRVTPRMMAGFLRWTQMQAWGPAFREALPVGGVDGTISRRFRGTALEGRVFAKTGSLAGVNALSGFMLTKSGEMLIFSAYANDRPSVAESAVAALDAALVEIAAGR